MEESIGQESDIELLFIKEVLDQHGEYIVDLLHNDIAAKKLRLEDKLLASLEYRTPKSGNNPMFELSFFGYNRALESAGINAVRIPRNGLKTFWLLILNTFLCCRTFA